MPPACPWACPAQAIGDRLCAQTASAAAQALYEALSAGGAHAEAAVAALLLVECRGGLVEGAKQAAFDAFLALPQLGGPQDFQRCAEAPACLATSGCMLCAALPRHKQQPCSVGCRAEPAWPLPLPPAGWR